MYHHHTDGLARLDICVECQAIAAEQDAAGYSEMADSNRLWALIHDVKCAECGHIYPMNMVDACDCCRQARDLFLEHGDGTQA